jgi:hypothetical protein
MERRQRRDGVARPRILAHSARESELPGWRGRWCHGTAAVALTMHHYSSSLMGHGSLLADAPRVKSWHPANIIEPALYVGLMLARNSTIRVSDSDWFGRLVDRSQS